MHHRLREKRMADGTQQVQFVFTADAHYGVKRAALRGAANVSARIANTALVRCRPESQSR
jgi:hypothetical protein